MWLNRKLEAAKTRLRDLEAVHQILMVLPYLDAVRVDQELRDVIMAAEKKVLAKSVKLRLEIHSPIVRKFW